MKQLLQRTFALRAIVLVILLTGMVSRIWAEDVTVTYTFTSKEWNATVDEDEANWTSNKDGAGFSNKGIQVTTSATGANGTTPVAYSNITKIVATYNTNKSSGAGSIVAKIGNNNETSNNVAYSSGDGRTANYTTEFTYSTSQSGAVTITVNTKTNSIYLVSIAITYEKAAVETSPLASIAVDASSAKTVFHVGDEFTYEGAVVTATYEDKSTNDVTSDATFSTPDMTTVGTKTVTVSYTENGVKKTTTYYITVNAPAALSSISLSGTYPTEFTQGDAFSAEGIVVTANYDDETTKDVTDEATFSGYDMTATGEQTVTVTYGEKTANYTITVNEYVMPSELTIDFESELSTYSEWAFSGIGTTNTAITAHNGAKYGATINSGGNGMASSTITTKNKVNPEKITFYVSKVSTNTTSSSWYVEVSEDGETWTKVGNAASATNMSKGTWNEVSRDLSSYSNVYVRIRYDGSTAIRTIDDIILEMATPKVLSSIALSGEYATTFHVGDAFSAEGMTVTATYDNGKTADVTASATFSGYDMTNAGEQTVTVSYTEGEVTKTATYTITIKAPPTLTSISVTVNNPIELYQGDEFSSEGIVVTANYDDDTTKDVTADATFSGYDMSTTGEQTVTVTYGEKTDTYTITVVVKKGTQNNPYTVAEAVDAIDNGGTTSNVYVTGIVSQVDSYSSGAITYWISADGTTTNQFEVYKGKNTNGDNFSSVDDVKVGDVVVVCGKIVLYNSSIYEFSAGSQLVSLVRKLAVPTFSPEAGAVVAGTEVTISAVEGATIYYTVDGSTPTTESTEYTEAITISETTTIKAFAVKEGIPSSDVVEATFTIAAPAATPTFSVAAGTYSSAQSVVISCETEDATIYYTLDGTEPTTESTEYTEAVVINETTTIKAIAVKEGLANSEVAEATYTIQIPSITLSSNSIATTYKENEGTLEVTYNYITEVTAEVVFCDAEGTAATYDWIEAEINAENNIAYVISANASEEARTAYMKVYTIDDETNDVYSEIITITQEGMKTYYALVGEYGGKYYAVNAQGGKTWNATEVDAVNGKVLNGTDDIAWEFIPNGKSVGLRNKTKTSDGNWIYIGYNTSGTDLKSSTSIVSWTVDSDNETWTNQNGNTSGTVRSIIYSDSAKGFKNYAVGNVDESGYGSYTHAYTFADGCVRPVTAGNWGTFCVDHSIAADDYSGVTFYSIAGKDKNENYLSLKEERGELMAGVAYIFQANEGATKLVAAYSDESIDEPFAAEDNNGLAGSFTGQDVEEGMYLLSGGKIVKCGTGCTIAANRAYIDMDAVPVLGNESASEGLVKLFLGTTDAVRGIDADNLNGAVIYDLSGRRLQNAQRGLYIVNGKKVAVK